MSDLIQISVESSSLLSSPVALYLASLASNNSRRSCKSDLDTIATMMSKGRVKSLDFPWHELKRPHVQVLMSMLREKYAYTTANRMRASLRGVLKECWRIGSMTNEEYAKAIDVPPIKGSRPLKGRALHKNEITALLQVCNEDKSPHGVRDAAMLALLRTCGLRRSEVVKLDVKDISQSDRSITIRGSKGNKTRIVPLSSHLLPRLERWLQLRTETGIGEGAVFVRIRGSKITDKRLSDQTVGDMLARRCKEAGIEAETTSHDLRRSAISELFDAGVDVSTIQRFAGHSNPTTSARYDRRGEDATKKAVENLSL